MMIRVPFFLRVGFNKGNQKEKGQKGITQEPRSCTLTGHHEPQKRSERVVFSLFEARGSNIGALIGRIGFRGKLYYTYNQELPK